MKKYFYFIYALSLGGIILSLILLADHYMPDITAGFLRCNPISGCSQISQSPYSEILGVPFAALGLFFYLWILLSAFLFHESGEFYAESFPYIFLPVAVFGVIFDMYLAGLLIYIKIFCKFCFSTYIINLIMLFAAIMFYRANIKKTKKGYKERVVKFIKDLDDSPVLKFSSGVYIFFTSILFLFIISFSFYLKEVSSGSDFGEKSDAIIMQEYLDDYIDSENIKMDFPESNMIIGNSEGLEVIVVTDPFCSACFSFYQIEKEILKKYGDKIYFKYYFYPLDAKCNYDLKDEIYKNSCKAVQAIIAFSYFSDFKNVMESHYENFKKLKNVYGRDEFDLKYLYESYDMNDKPVYDEFESYFNNGSAEAELMKNIKSSIDHDVEATPTIFIKGRKIEGAPPLEMFEKIIEFELGNKD